MRRRPALPTFLAVDLGAESGRVVQGDLEDGRLRLAEIARFPTAPSVRDGRLRWPFEPIVDDVIEALRSVGEADGVGVDTWGVDFGLLDGDDRLIEPPVAYRDSRTSGVMERFLERVPATDVYRRTGTQFLPFNTLYQLAAMDEAGDEALARARRLLLMPDLLHHRLCGRAVTERTNASTTQFLNVETGRFDRDLVRAAGVDPDILPEIVEPGTILGEAPRDLGLGNVPVVAPATHDTASAVAAIPARGDDWACVSSGTWSLVGVETARPVATEEARRAKLTNEAGVGGRTRLLRNVMGLWLVQRLRAAFDDTMDYAEVTRRAEEAAPLRSLVDPDAPRFLDPPSMPDAIAAACREAGQPVPDSPGAFVRCALESLALRYREIVDDLERIRGIPIRRIHVVGGGSRNALLCRMTAGATGRPVVAGPVEATSAGNALVQAMALGHCASLEEARRIVRDSFDPVTYDPTDTDRWEDARS
jgi:rhamnulokinase